MDTPATASRQVDVAAVLDGGGLTRFHWFLLGLSCLITMFEGLDISLMSYTSPYVRDELHLGGGQLGVLLTAAILGQVVGGFLITRFSDAFGRRPTIIASCYLFSLLTIGTGFIDDYAPLVTIRFLDGLAIGGLLPTAWALNIEFAPKPRRSTVVAAIMLGYSVGSALAGPVTNLIAPSQGWRAVYLWAGVGTLLASIALHRWLPESVRYLVARGGDSSRIAALLNRVSGRSDARPTDRFRLADESHSGTTFRVAQLFAGDLRQITPLLWIGYMASSFAIYLNSMWGPMLLEALYVPRQSAALIASTVALCGAVLGLILVRSTEHWGPRGVMICPALALPLLLVMGSGAIGTDSFVPFVLASGTLINTGHAMVVSIAGIYYPSAIRASGGGWATAVAKCGAVFGPIVGGAIVASHLPVIRTYAVLALCPFVLLLAVFGIARVLKRREAQPAAPAART